MGNDMRVRRCIGMLLVGWTWSVAARPTMKEKLDGWCLEQNEVLEEYGRFAVDAEFGWGASGFVELVKKDGAKVERDPHLAVRTKFSPEQWTPLNKEFKGIDEIWTLTYEKTTTVGETKFVDENLQLNTEAFVYINDRSYGEEINKQNFEQRPLPKNPKPMSKIQPRTSSPAETEMPYHVGYTTSDEQTEDDEESHPDSITPEVNLSATISELKEKEKLRPESFAQKLNLWELTLLGRMLSQKEHEYLRNIIEALGTAGLVFSDLYPFAPDTKGCLVEASSKGFDSTTADMISRSEAECRKRILALQENYEACWLGMDEKFPKDPKINFSCREKYRKLIDEIGEIVVHMQEIFTVSKIPKYVAERIDFARVREVDRLKESLEKSPNYPYYQLKKQYFYSEAVEWHVKLQRSSVPVMRGKDYIRPDVMWGVYYHDYAFMVDRMATGRDYHELECLLQNEQEKRTYTYYELVLETLRKRTWVSPSECEQVHFLNTFCYRDHLVPLIIADEYSFDEANFRNMYYKAHFDAKYLTLEADCPAYLKRRLEACSAMSPSQRTQLCLHYLLAVEWKMPSLDYPEMETNPNSNDSLRSYSETLGFTDKAFPVWVARIEEDEWKWRRMVLAFYMKAALFEGMTMDESQIITVNSKFEAERGKWDDKLEEIFDSIAMALLGNEKIQFRLNYESFMTRRQRGSYVSGWYLDELREVVLRGYEVEYRFLRGMADLFSETYVDWKLLDMGLMYVLVNGKASKKEEKGKKRAEAWSGLQKNERFLSEVHMEGLRVLLAKKNEDLKWQDLRRCIASQYMISNVAPTSRTTPKDGKAQQQNKFKHLAAALRSTIFTGSVNPARKFPAERQFPSVVTDAPMSLANTDDLAQSLWEKFESSPEVGKWVKQRPDVIRKRCEWHALHTWYLPNTDDYEDDGALEDFVAAIAAIKVRASLKNPIIKPYNKVSFPPVTYLIADKIVIAENPQTYYIKQSSINAFHDVDTARYIRTLNGSNREEIKAALSQSKSYIANARKKNPFIVEAPPHSIFTKDVPEIIYPGEEVQTNIEGDIIHAFAGDDTLFLDIVDQKLRDTFQSKIRELLDVKRRPLFGWKSLRTVFWGQNPQDIVFATSSGARTLHEVEHPRYRTLLVNKATMTFTSLTTFMYIKMPSPGKKYSEKLSLMAQSVALLTANEICDSKGPPTQPIPQIISIPIPAKIPIHDRSFAAIFTKAYREVMTKHFHLLEGYLLKHDELVRPFYPQPVFYKLGDEFQHAAYERSNLSTLRRYKYLEGIETKYKRICELMHCGEAYFAVSPAEPHWSACVKLRWDACEEMRHLLQRGLELAYFFNAEDSKNRLLDAYTEEIHLRLSFKKMLSTEESSCDLANIQKVNIEKVKFPEIIDEIHKNLNVAANEEVQCDPDTYAFAGLKLIAARAASTSKEIEGNLYEFYFQFGSTDFVPSNETVKGLPGETSASIRAYALKHLLGRKKSKTYEETNDVIDETIKQDETNDFIDKLLWLENADAIKPLEFDLQHWEGSPLGTVFSLSDKASCVTNLNAKYAEVTNDTQDLRKYHKFEQAVHSCNELVAKKVSELKTLELNALVSWISRKWEVLHARRSRLTEYILHKCVGRAWTVSWRESKSEAQRCAKKMQKLGKAGESVVEDGLTERLHHTIACVLLYQTYSNRDQHAAVYLNNCRRLAEASVRELLSSTGTSEQFDAVHRAQVTQLEQAFKLEYPPSFAVTHSMADALQQNSQNPTAAPTAPPKVTPAARRTTQTAEQLLYGKTSWTDVGKDTVIFGSSENDSSKVKFFTKQLEEEYILNFIRFLARNIEIKGKEIFPARCVAPNTSTVGTVDLDLFQKPLTETELTMRDGKLEARTPSFTSHDQFVPSFVASIRNFNFCPYDVVVVRINLDKIHPRIDCASFAQKLNQNLQIWWGALKVDDLYAAANEVSRPAKATTGDPYIPTYNSGNHRCVPVINVSTEENGDEVTADEDTINLNQVRYFFHMLKEAEMYRPYDEKREYGSMSGKWNLDSILVKLFDLDRYTRIAQWHHQTTVCKGLLRHARKEFSRLSYLVTKLVHTDPLLKVENTELYPTICLIVTILQDFPLMTSTLLIDTCYREAVVRDLISSDINSSPPGTQTRKYLVHNVPQQLHSRTVQKVSRKFTELNDDSSFTWDKLEAVEKTFKAVQSLFRSPLRHMERYVQEFGPDLSPCFFSNRKGVQLFKIEPIIGLKKRIWGHCGLKKKSKNLPHVDARLTLLKLPPNFFDAEQHHINVYKNYHMATRQEFPGSPPATLEEYANSNREQHTIQLLRETFNKLPRDGATATIGQNRDRYSVCDIEISHDKLPMVPVEWNKYFPDANLFASDLWTAHNETTVRVTGGYAQSVIYSEDSTAAFYLVPDDSYNGETVITNLIYVQVRTLDYEQIGGLLENLLCHAMNSFTSYMASEIRFPRKIPTEKMRLKYAQNLKEALGDPKIVKKLSDDSAHPNIDMQSKK